MKGIVFTEFLELVEERYGLEMVDHLITEADLPSGGVYTSVGTYQFSEMLSLLVELSEQTGTPIDSLLEVYGEHFFGVVLKSYPGFIAQYTDPLDLLASIESHIHVEVRKIYPDAELPVFRVLEKDTDKLTLVYRSSRAMYAFGKGLKQRTLAHFGQQAEILVEKIKEDGTEVKFSIRIHE
ncbi:MULTISPECIES: heme NO-binding domain-containing protein [unclassified Leeuwenhoekiella]|uniref:heme NO-binding domain-containing protein n=1 Tax=unclassified Leeuwenhoekiella TaxID=2615029 RepID=UPI000C3667D2|nr:MULTISPECIES: heme NO-binding domain-containing protein [unclassified Leeuwenhoekiella]MAW97032.1 hypothetical protein [Leeuwenhoekiella sp.]MBA80687.1 hypothetical protein [Leeuwenhoekiella sp.]|tara:strand:- start:46439 stop:46981 length:543 start_codon:yes stop_codon:yes gene_type:complete